MSIPFISRLRVLEWPQLIFGLLLVVLESFLRFVTSWLPSWMILIFEKITRKIYATFLPAATRDRTVVHQIYEAPDFVNLCAIFGYRAEEHIVMTRDGYLLGVHRICKTKAELARERSSSSDSDTAGSQDSKPKPVVYLHHGLLMNSEIWVCLTEAQRCLPFILVELGYDVWLGNNRGNKYSKKHVTHSPEENKFWDFSMDEFALYDIPDTIDYILDTSGQSSLAYIGFSQGSAQAFAALSLHPKLNDKVKVFVALAPAMAPHGLRIGIVDALVKASPTLMYLFFGRKAILSSAIFWQSIMYPPLFVRLIDSSLIFLFDWHGDNITLHQKIASYAHLYSFASVKTVVHWFQIMRHRCFQMFDDDLSTPLRLYGNAFYKVAQFPTRNIRSPIYLIYGTKDSLVDIDTMLDELPPHATAIPVEGHEHLDIIWGADVGKVVIPHVLRILGKYYDVEHDLDDEYTNLEALKLEKTSSNSSTLSFAHTTTRMSISRSLSGVSRAGKPRPSALSKEVAAANDEGTLPSETVEDYIQKEENGERHEQSSDGDDASAHTYETASNLSESASSSETVTDTVTVVPLPPPSPPISNSSRAAGRHRSSSIRSSSIPRTMSPDTRTPLHKTAILSHAQAEGGNGIVLGAAEPVTGVVVPGGGGRTVVRERRRRMSLAMAAPEPIDETATREADKDEENNAKENQKQVSFGKKIELTGEKIKRSFLGA
ncbi:Alpha/Beta hydrolase protein [Myxozyma melibiosi]|uniref:Alpha/Beta hydrolase protein n=1 Tax=Myxozyma melibiosi TaxID=54550 RepID=A0ABR1FDT5_9ASCO